LEKIALAELVVSNLACIGVSNGYNVALGLFLLYSCYHKHGRTNAIAALLTLLTLIVDVVILALYGNNLSTAGKQYAFGLGMVVAGMFFKCLAEIAMFFVYSDSGSSLAFPGSVGSGGGSSTDSYQPHESDDPNLAKNDYQTGSK